MSNHVIHAPSSQGLNKYESFSYCGKLFHHDNEFHFKDADHAILTIEQGSFIQPCKECIKEIKRILK